MFQSLTFGHYTGIQLSHFFDASFRKVEMFDLLNKVFGLSFPESKCHGYMFFYHLIPSLYNFYLAMEFNLGSCVI